ncbi:transposase family protein [Streptomyces sp. NPDC051109]|uniref:transposase family protein n=1 Tax=Streptomyces sp. NPDC051109 TaxID=3365642 RepID=UPI00378C50E5
MKLTWARAVCSHPALSGVSRVHSGELLEELASPWEAARESALRDQRGGCWRRSAGVGRKPKLVFVDRLLVTLIHLRHGLPHAVPAEFFSVDRSTVFAAIRQVRTLLAARGLPGLRPSRQAAQPPPALRRQGIQGPETDRASAESAGRHRAGPRGGLALGA